MTAWYISALYDFFIFRIDNINIFRRIEIQLEGLCMDLLSAGTDTTSSLITFAIMFLAIHQDIQKKIHQEMDKVLCRDRLPTIADRTRYKTCYVML